MRKTYVLRFALSVLAAAFLLMSSSTVRLTANAASIPVLRDLPRDEPEVNSFKGKILSQNGDRFILRDDVNNAWYHLDDQLEARKFFGKEVLVTGTLDGRSDMIRVRSIVESKS